MENADYSLLNEPDMQEIFISFLVETKEILERLDLDLVELENRPQDADLLNQIFRAFHTVKGTAGFLGLLRLQKLTHVAEDILNKLRKGEMVINDFIMDAILNAYDGMKDLVAVIEENKNENFDTSSIITQLEEALAGKTELDAPAKTEASEVSSDEEDEIDEEETLEQPVVESVPIPQPKKAEKSGAAVQATAKKGENTIRVDVDRLDDLLNLVSELVLGRNMLSQINLEASMQYEGTRLVRDLGETSRHIDRMTTELHLAVMKTRMIKIGKVFNRFPRVVRDLSKDAGKKIKLEIKGEHTELDKTLIEEINDPLVHLVRNSADHGIEMPEDRKKLGKPETGTITLAAEHEGNNIIITIEDDGKGMDPEMLKEKAVSKGLLTKEKAAELSKKDAFNLIFAPGFSTAAKVTNVSGRGVGMDVVKTNVTKLRGIINIDSEVGVGTKIIIKLPLTLAIIQGLLVKIAEESIVIPLSSVVEVVHIPKEQIYHVNKNEVIKLRDGILPLVNINELLYSKGSVGEGDWQYIVVVGIAEKKYGIKVDSLIGQNEAVIKSLGNYLGEIEGIAGSTIMGDGKVVMIADIAELVNKLVETNNVEG
ncbi:MAG: chemotaxis protein CheA [Melioribacteraceae bacterium]|nr:chemotaxis protein CheA [Melioribacteraceae bacterium]